VVGVVVLDEPSHLVALFGVAEGVPEQHPDDRGGEHPSDEQPNPP
jgi:hypothetical protein